MKKYTYLFAEKEVGILTFEYVCVVVTNKCNLNCNYCYRMNSKLDYMSIDSFEDYANKLKQLGGHTINITGGEPLLNPTWRHFVKYSHEIGLKVILSTNAILLDLDDPILELIDILVIPLDGSSEAVNSKYRGKGHFTIVSNLIEKYKKGNYHFLLKINTVMTFDNYCDLTNMIPIISGNNIFWRIFFCKLKGDYNHISHNDLIIKEDYIRKVKELYATLPDSLMYDKCIEDSSLDITYTLVTSDGMLYVSKGENDILIGCMDTLSAEEIYNNTIKKGFSINKHNLCCGI